RLAGSVRLRITYEHKRGVISHILQACDKHNWALTELSSSPDGGVLLTLTGTNIRHAASAVAGVEGVTSVRRIDAGED
ncbi:MAG TPA: MgtC/SapB family protein, partial [Mycobacterium sp.]|nr:MgtC/SapB family protein [Mycobacterium sp.]